MSIWTVLAIVNVNQYFFFVNLSDPGGLSEKIDLKKKIFACSCVKVLVSYGIFHAKVNWFFWCKLFYPCPVIGIITKYRAQEILDNTNPLLLSVVYRVSQKDFRSLFSLTKERNFSMGHPVELSTIKGWEKKTHI